MAYKWVKQADKTSKNPLANAFKKTNQSAVSQTVDPMEDWEKATRTDNKPGEQWQPVYVSLKFEETLHPKSKVATELLLEADARPRIVYLSEDARASLKHIEAFGANIDDLDPCLQFFIFRREATAYTAISKPEPNKKDRALYEVLFVGPSIPDSAVPRLLSSDDAAREGATIELDKPVCVTGVIDDQIGFLNERFRCISAATEKATQSRIDALMLMGQPVFDSAVVNQGVQKTQSEIDQMMTSNQWEEDGYAEAYPFGVFYMPPSQSRQRKSDIYDRTFRRPYAFQSGHGTHVLDLAAGYPAEWDVKDRPIFAMQLPRLAAFETSGARLDFFVLMAVIRMLRWADELYVDTSSQALPVPLVLNISYGVLAGPKDGTGFLEREIARRVAWRNMRKDKPIPTVVVMPSGNGFRSQTRARMSLAPTEANAVTLRVPPEDLSVSFVEFWMDKGAKGDLTLTPPVGKPFVVKLSGKPSVIDWQDNGVTIGRVYVQSSDQTGRRWIVLALCPTLNHDDRPKTAPAGAYGIEVRNAGKALLTVDIDVQRDDTPSTFPRYGKQAYLDDPGVEHEDPETYDLAMPDPGKSYVTRNGTMSALATSVEDTVVVVGGAFDRHAFSKAALYSASGLGLDCGGPKLAAASEETRAHPGRLAAGLFSGSTSMFMGTSGAAPQVARAIADQFAAQIAKGTLPKDVTYDISALIDPKPGFVAQDERLGFGAMAFKEEPGRHARRLRS